MSERPKWLNQGRFQTRVQSRRVRRLSLAVVAASALVAGCGGPTVPLEVGLADRPVDLLLGERINEVATAPLPPVALPPPVLPDFDFGDIPIAVPDFGDLTVTPPTWPSHMPTTTTLALGCSATPPKAPANRDSFHYPYLPPKETPSGDKGYVMRTEGEIAVGRDQRTVTSVAGLSRLRIENVETYGAPFPAASMATYFPVLRDGTTTNYADDVVVSGMPTDFSFDVVSDLGTPASTSRTKYRVQVPWRKVTYRDTYTAAADGTIARQFIDGKPDDFFTDRNGDGNVVQSVPGEMYIDKPEPTRPQRYPATTTPHLDYLQRPVVDTPGKPNFTINNWDIYKDHNGNGWIDAGASTWTVWTATYDANGNQLTKTMGAYPVPESGPVWGPGVTSWGGTNPTMPGPDTLGRPSLLLPDAHRAGQPFRDERYIDKNGDGMIGGWADATSVITLPLNADGSAPNPPTKTVVTAHRWSISALVVDTNGDGVADAPETQFPDANFNYAPDGKGDLPSFTDTGLGTFGLYLVSMQTGNEAPVVFSKERVATATGTEIVSAPGARLAELPFVESSTKTTEAFSANLDTSFKFESTVFGRSDVDICRTDFTGWKIALDRGFIVRNGNNQTALTFAATYNFASQYGGISLEDETEVSSITQGKDPVVRTIKSVFTTEPALAVNPAG